MRTIIVPIYSRPEARIMLFTDIIKTLLQTHDARLVFLVPAFYKEEYQKTLGSNSVRFESVEKPTHTRSLLDAFFYRLSLYYVDSPIVRIERKEHLTMQGKKIRYILSSLLLSLLGYVPVLRRVLRFLDFLFIRRNDYTHFFETYTPDVVFLPSLVHKIEHHLVREARRKGILTIGMTHSPEEIMLSRLPLRIVPDRLIVYNDVSYTDAIRFFDMSPDHIYVSGNPLFDRYRTPSHLSREKFCKKFGIPVSHKIILFMSVADLNPTEWQVLKEIDDAIQNDTVPSATTVLVRHYPEKNIYIGNTEYSYHIVFDNSKIIFDKNKTYADILKDEMMSFTDMLLYADCVITTASKTNLSAAVFNKPIINLGYDGWEKKQFSKSVRRFYTDTHPYYTYSLESGAVAHVYSKDELLDNIKVSLRDPKVKEEGRARLCATLAPLLDGQAGYRVGKYIQSAMM